MSIVFTPTKVIIDPISDEFGGNGVAIILFDTEIFAIIPAKLTDTNIIGGTLNVENEVVGGAVELLLSSATTSTEQTSIIAAVAAHAGGVKDLGAFRAGFRTGALRIRDQGDPTKMLAWDVTGVSAGHTRTVFMPDTDVTLGGPLLLRHRWTYGSEDLLYVPFDGSSSDSASITSDEVRTFFAYSMKLTGIVAWNLGATPPDSTKFGLHINNDTDAQMLVTVDMDANDSPFYFDFSGGTNETTAGQFVALSWEPLSAPGASSVMRAISYWQPV